MPAETPAPVKIRGVILDIDGTLVDSNDAHARSWLDALAEAGWHQIEYDQVRRLIGMGGDKLLPSLIGVEESSPQGQALSKRRGEIFREKHLPNLKAFPRAQELLETMKAYGLKLAIATSASEADLQGLLRLFGGEDLVESKTTKDDAENSKPDPDIIRAALRKIDFPAHEVLMLGDTPYDIEAAARAGVRTVAVTSGGWSRRALSGAAAIFENAEDLLQNFDRSPFAPEAKLKQAG